MSAASLLERLSNVRQVAPGRWVACCPCHESRSRASLAITEAADGRVLLCDHGGCPTADVLGAVGLAFDVLFPPRLVLDESASGRRRYSTRVAQPYVSAQVLDAVAGEALVAAVIASDVAKGHPVSHERAARLWDAAGRLSSVAGWAHGR